MKIDLLSISFIKSIAPIALITLIPILLWGIYFYFRNPRRQPVSEVIKIFLIGTFSVFPVILFHKSFSHPATKYLTELLNVEIGFVIIR